jgi:hypothetical protein
MLTKMAGSGPNTGRLSLELQAAGTTKAVSARYPRSDAERAEHRMLARSAQAINFLISSAAPIEPG